MTTFENSDAQSTLEITSGSCAGDSDSRIKVYCRIRPVATFSVNYQFLKDAHPPAILVVSPVRSETKRAEFCELLDQPEQVPVFLKCCHPLLHNFVSKQESNILFTSGITSSGKTFTMVGDAENPGMIPLGLTLLFGALKDRLITERLKFVPKGFNNVRFISSEIERTSITDKLRRRSQESAKYVTNTLENIEKSIAKEINQLKIDLDANNTTNDVYSIWISFYEIYNNQIFDLLAENNRNALNIVHETGGVNGKNAYVDGLAYLPVISADEAYGHFLVGQTRNHFGSTSLNATSSRSHSFFNVRLIRSNKRSNNIITSTFTFCDLAGAERVNKTNNFGSRLDESNKINQSLMNLNRCIKLIKEKQRNKGLNYVPFRDAKLTHVLQPFLSGSGRISIIFTLNPSQNLLEESYFSLEMCHDVQTIRQVNSINISGSVLGRRELAFKRSNPSTSNKPSVFAGTPSKKSKLQTDSGDIKHDKSTINESYEEEKRKILRRKQRMYKKAYKKLQDLESKVKLETDHFFEMEDEEMEKLKQLQEEFIAEQKAIIAMIEGIGNEDFELNEKEMFSE